MERLPENTCFGLEAGSLAETDSRVAKAARELDDGRIFGSVHVEACLRTRCACEEEDLQLTMKIVVDYSILASMIPASGADRILQSSVGALACLSPSKYRESRSSQPTQRQKLAVPARSPTCSETAYSRDHLHGFATSIN
jgi:hypothetical protein